MQTTQAKTGIVGYGASIPRMRVRVSEIARVWGKHGEQTAAALGVQEKAIASLDEDSCTLAVGASRKAIESARIDAQRVGAIFVGSESKPYAVKPTASIVAEAIGATPNLTAADLEFACKAGTAGMQACMGLVASGMIEYGLAVGSDTSQGRPGDALEFSTGCGAGAFVIGPAREAIAVIEATASITTDTPDFWRRQHQEFPRHGGRFTGKPAYFKHVVGAANALLQKTGFKASDFDYAVFHQPNGKFPLEAATQLGIEREKLVAGLVTPFIGNTYSAATMIGLSAILDEAKPGQRILAVSYGSGAGSDAFALTVTDAILGEGRRPALRVWDLINRKEYVDYAVYVKHRRKLKSM
ncbi:MAG: hydroxymethylglutaryl-CoA synthase [Candidatus Norongarragalinales archaeon]